jgi:hypothetical protein
VGVAARGWVHAVCFIVAMINSNQLVVVSGSYGLALMRPALFCSFALDVWTWPDGRAMGLSHESIYRAVRTRWTYVSYGLRHAIRINEPGPSFNPI